MHPLQYLLVNRPESPAELAKVLIARGVEFGASATSKLSGNDLSRMASGAHSAQAWLIKVSFLFAIEEGWIPTSLEELRIATNTWRRLNPAGTLDAFCAACRVNPRAPDLRVAWNASERYAKTTP